MRVDVVVGFRKDLRDGGGGGGGVEEGGAFVAEAGGGERWRPEDEEADEESGDEEDGELAEDEALREGPSGNVSELYPCSIPRRGCTDWELVLFAVVSATYSESGM